MITCKDCIHFQKTLLTDENGQPVYDCPLSDDWCEPGTLINTRCDGCYEPNINRMTDWEDFKNASFIKAKAQSNGWEPVNIKCPKCGQPIFKNLTIVLTSNPPQYQYKCLHCGWVGTAFD